MGYYSELLSISTIDETKVEKFNKEIELLKQQELGDDFEDIKHNMLIEFTRCINEADSDGNVILVLDDLNGKWHSLDKVSEFMVKYFPIDQVCSIKFKGEDEQFWGLFFYNGRQYDDVIEKDSEIFKHWCKELSIQETEQDAFKKGIDLGLRMYA